MASESSSFSVLLRGQAYDKWTTYKSHKCKVLEIYAYKGLDVTSNGAVPVDEKNIKDWLYQRGAFVLPDHGQENPFLGGLRLLIQEWDNDDYATKQVVPFNDRTTFQDLMTALRLSPDYPYLFRHSEFVAPRVVTAIDSVSHAAITNIVFQSPSFSNSFSTLSLSYNSHTRMTSGFLGYVKKGHEELLPSILSCKADARHPFMLPLLCLNNFLQMLRKETRWQSQERNTLAKLVRKAAQTSHLDSVDFPSIHERLIDSHLVLTNAMGNFVNASSTLLRSHLSSTAEVLSAESQSDAYFVEKSQDLMRCMQLVDMTTRDLISQRERISIRVDVLLKVLYNHMQQRDSEINRDLAKQSTQMAIESTAIAEATQKDSASMKAIAVLTMVFLPGTAVSTMFSMSVFFAVADDSQVTVNSSFWLYWAITIPLTLIVLGTWAVWLYLDDLKRIFLGAWRTGLSRKTTAAKKSAQHSIGSTSADILMNDLSQSSTVT